MGKLRWWKVAKLILILAIPTIGLPMLVIWFLTEPVVYCYSEDTPNQVEYGVQKCLQPDRGAIAAEKL